MGDLMEGAPRTEAELGVNGGHLAPSACGDRASDDGGSVDEGRHAGSFVRRDALGLACVGPFLVSWGAQRITGWYIDSEDASPDWRTGDS